MMAHTLLFCGERSWLLLACIEVFACFPLAFVLV